MQSDSIIEPNAETPSQPGVNSKGLATLTVDGTRPVVIEYIDRASGFYHVTDLETGKPYTIYRTSFRMIEIPIPQKYRKEKFDRVAWAWAKALKAYPQAAMIDIKPLSFVSYARLLREAREAKNKYGWEHPLINDGEWNLHQEAITVTDVGGGIIALGPKTAKFPADNKPVGRAIDASEVFVDWKTQADLEALLGLLDRKLIRPVPRFAFCDLTAELIATLESRFQVAFVPHEQDPNKWSVIT